MIKKKSMPNGSEINNGFTMAELTITTAIAATLAAFAYPNYVSSNYRAQLSEAQTTMEVIPKIISAYIDETGELPTSWDNLSSIVTVMSNDGPATGSLNTPFILPSSNYKLSIEGPTKSIYTLTASRIEENTNRYEIKSCFNVSNGSSDLTRGTSNEGANTPDCG